MIKFNRLIAKSMEEFSLKDEFDSLTEIYYILKKSKQTYMLSVSHWDLYRLRECPIELLDEEFKGSIVLIEWANKFEEVNEISDISLNFEILEDNQRKIIVK